jgi:two-component system nitrogen regulation response regulator GlnG
MSVVLVIDDDPMVQHWCRRELADRDVTVVEARTAAEGLAVVGRQRVDVVMLDVMLPDMSGLETYQQIHERVPKLPVIFITAGGESETAIEAMKLGALDYLFKPLDRQRVRERIARAVDMRRLMETPVEFDLPAGSEDRNPDRLVGRCAAMQEVYKAIGRVAPQDVTVLIRGESGTGKELVARAIYQHSRRANGPFLAINCAAIPESLLESELFGHERGAFTGAEARHIGKFEQSTGGTLFMDEIGDMSPSTQSKILRVLQQQRFERLGGGETIETDVRILAATNRNLEQLVTQGKFRSDLYYRLNVVSIELSPLRERITDISLLLQHFLAVFRVELGKEVTAISPEAMDMLLSYHWPGNVREFQSVIKHAMLHASGPVLLPDFLPDTLRGSRAKTTSQADSLHRWTALWEEFIEQRVQQRAEGIYGEALAMMERSLFTAVLRHTEGNKLQAARILGITRGTLRNKMNALGISVEQTISSDER